MASLLSPLPHTDSHTAAARAGADPAAQEPLPTTGATTQPPPKRGGHSITTDNNIDTKLGALSGEKGRAGWRYII